MQENVSGAKVLSHSLLSQGINMFFTVPTPRLAPLLNALEKEDHVRVVTAHNETSAALMAEGYIRRSRCLAAVITDSGARAMSQICGVTNAWADKIPLVSISLCLNDTPDTNRGVERRRFDQKTAFQAVTSWNVRLSAIETAPREIAKCLAESCRHKKGPVHIDIPCGLLDHMVPADILSGMPVMPQRLVEPVRMRAKATAVAEAARLLLSSKKPLIFCGGGVKASDACPDLMKLVETMNIPVATSMAGIGSVPISHPLCLGGPSYTSGEVFHVAIKDADVVLALGAAFSGLDGFGLPPLWSGKIRFIHVDIDPMQLGLNVQPEVSITADVKTFFEQLEREITDRSGAARSAWKRWTHMLQKLKKIRAKRLERDAKRKGAMMHQAQLALELNRIKEEIKEDPILVMDGGNTVLYLAMYAPDLDPYQAFYPYGMAALGGGIAYAVGVALASPGTPVFLITGDGSFMYNVQELETIKRLNLPVTIFMNNDRAWNMIRAMQTSFFTQNYVGTDLENVDYVPIARGFGFHAEQVSRPEEIIPAYGRARKSKGPAFIECITDKANTPDSLISFALVEFDGALKYLNPVRFLQSMWMMRKIGLGRNLYQLSYIVKALLGVNLRARRF